MIKFPLFLVFLVLVAQVSLVLFNAAYFYAIIFSFLLGGLLSENNLSKDKIKKIIQQGLIFLVLGNILAIIIGDSKLYTFSQLVSGVGAGMLIFSGWNEMRQLSLHKNLKFLFWLCFFTVLAIFIGPESFRYLSSGKPEPLAIASLFVILLSLWSLFNISRWAHAFFLKAYEYLDKAYHLLAFVIEPIKKHKRKLGHAGLAYSFDMGVNFLSNFVLYPYIMWKFGLVNGFLIMITYSFLICWAYIIIYDRLKKDLFLLEDVKAYMEKIGRYQGQWKILRLMALVIRKGGKTAAFFYLSLWRDPFYAVAFCRSGKYNGLSFNDWMIFIASLIIGNASWALVVFGGVTSVEKLIH